MGAPEEPEGTRGPSCGAYVPSCSTGGGGSNNNRELKTAEYQRSDFKPEIQSRELHAKLLRRRQGPAAAPVGGGGHCTRYVVMHPLRGDAPVTW